MSTESIKFSATDGVALTGYINKGETKTDKILIEIHGMTSNCYKKRENIIAKKVEEIGIDTICFNTRGSEIVKYIKYGDGRKTFAGTAYENIEESYCDIIGVIEYALSLGYKSIYLQGHSLGATKVVYVYSKMQKETNELLKYIKGIILLSLVDIPGMIKAFAKPEIIKYAEDKENKNELLDFMPNGSFIHPISVKTFLQYAKYNKNIDFARYGEENDEFEILNNINVPLFMRWGDTNELIKRGAKEQAEFMNRKIINHKKDIAYIKNCDHSYTKKEDELAEEIFRFLDSQE